MKKRNKDKYTHKDKVTAGIYDNLQKNIKPDKLRLTGILIFFIALTIFITLPLPSHMNGFLLPKEYSNISHSDTMQHMLKIQEVKERISAHQNPIIVDQADVSQIYIFFGLVATEILRINPVVYHNLFFMAVIFLSGILMYLFMLELSKDHLASIFAGFIYASSYYIRQTKCIKFYRLRSRNKFRLQGELPKLSKSHPFQDR